MSASKSARDAAASKRRAATPTRKRKVTSEGPLARASAATVELLDRMGLGWVTNALTTGLAAGVLVGEYGTGTARSQLGFYRNALRALVAAERGVAGSLAKGELLEVLARLVDVVALRIAQLTSLLGQPTRIDFDDIAARIADIDRRVAKVEATVKRKRSRKRSTASRVATRSVSVPPDTDPEPVPPRGGLNLPVDARPVVETATTTFIGSIPEGSPSAPRPARASSVSSEPDAISGYLAKNPDDPHRTGVGPLRGERGDDADR